MANATEWEPGADQTLVRAMIELLKGTSATSMTIASSGTFTFLTQPYLYFDEGQWIILIDNANSNNWMAGQVTTYNPITGSTVFVSKVSQGSGTIADWLVYLSGAWVDNTWNGGTVTNPVQINNTLGVTGTSTLARVNTSAPITSTAGDVNLNATVILSDADQTLTAAQLFGGTIVITPTAARILTLPTAASIIAYMSGYVVGSKFEFTVVNDSLNTVTIAPGGGVVQLGKTLIQDGAATFKVTIDSPTVVTVINQTGAVLTSRAGMIDSANTQVLSADLQLTSMSAGLQLISASQDGLSVILPDATTVYVSSPTFVFSNVGNYAIGIKDKQGNLLTVLDGNGQLTTSLADNSTIAGSWSNSRINNVPGMINVTATLDTSVGTARIFNTFVELTSSITVHFCELVAGGIGAFIVDSTNKSISTIFTVTTTASTAINGAFKVDAARLVVFYSDSANTLRAEVLLLSGSVLAIGSIASTGVITNIAVVNQVGPPKIIQLDSNLWLAIGSNTTNNNCIACQLTPGGLLTFGTGLNLGGAVPNSYALVKLTTTTALVLYRESVTTALVVSVTNVSSPVATAGATQVVMLSSRNDDAPIFTLLSPTLALVCDNNNVAGSMIAIACLISGTTISVGAPSSIETGLTTEPDYTESNATRFNPHAYTISATRALLWYVNNTGVSRALILDVNAGTGAITQGSRVTGSFSSAVYGAGFGVVLPQAPDHFVALLVTSSNQTYAAIVHKIVGNVITVGELTVFDSLLNVSTIATDIITGKLDNYTYAIAGFSSNALSGDLGISLLKADGFKLRFVGTIRKYLGGTRKGSSGVTVPQFPTTGKRIISICATREITSPASAAQLQVSDILTVS